MKYHTKIFLFTFLVLVGARLSAQDGRCPYRIDGLIPSSDYTVTVDGKYCFTEFYSVPTPSGPNISPRDANFVGRVGEYIGDRQDIAIARFVSDNPSSLVEISLPDYTETCRIKPEDAVADIAGIGSKTITFKMASDSYAYVEIDDLPPLLISSEKKVPMTFDKKDPKVKYYGPGVHEAGEIVLESGDVLFIDTGAIVYGTVKMNGCKDVVITGNGILDTSHQEKGAAIHFDKCSDISISGILVRSSKGGWMIVPSNCSDVRISDLKILGFGANNDGIDVVSNTDMHISHCFIRSTDDCIALKTGRNSPSSGIFIDDCTFYGFASSDGVVVGYEARSPIDSVFVRNCDVLSCRGTSPTGGKSPFSIICDGPGPITNIFFENCRISGDVEFKNLEISVTNGQEYVFMEPGKVDNVVFRDVHWGNGDVPLMIWGHDAGHKVTNVTFENCTMGGKPFDSHKNGIVLVNRYTDMIKFIYSGKERTFRRF